jgi:ferredoxin
MAKATVDADNCVGCGACESTCEVSAISLDDGKAVVNQETCVECGACESACPVSAISL